MDDEVYYTLVYIRSRGFENNRIAIEKSIAMPGK